MKAAAASLSLIVILGGCAGWLPPASAVPASGPLRAHILPPMSGTNDFNFWVDRPAHVAMFRIFPGRGTSLVYPLPGYGAIDGLAYGGYTRVAPRITNSQQFMPAFAGLAAVPQFYLLVASEQPLDLDRVGSYGMGLSSALGAQFASMSAYSTMENLVSLIVPNVEAYDWTTDFYVHWPQLDMRGAPPPSMVVISCNGQSFQVPLASLMAAYEALCAPPEQQSPPAGEEDVGDSDAPDVVEPTRRPPAVDTERIASTQLRDPEAWQEMRRAAAEGRELELGEEGGARAARPSRPDFTSPGSGRSGASRASTGSTRERDATGAAEPRSRGTSASGVGSSQPSTRPSTSAGSGSRGGASSGATSRPSGGASSGSQPRSAPSASPSSGTTSRGGSSSSSGGSARP